MPDFFWKGFELMEAGHNKIKYGFVILHYMAYDMTVECVSNLLHYFEKDSIKITIVDNASGNGSGKQLNELYSSNDTVEVLLNQKNDGFARGNNLGYRYLKENYLPQYIIVMNNDVLIEQNDFLERIDAIYKETGFAVLGPDIYCPATHKHQNPAHLNGFNREEVQQLYDTISKYSHHPAFYYYKKETFGKLKRKIFKKPQNVDTIDRSKTMENVVLHGACYIFSLNFIKKRENCFCPDTFLYMEEDILHYECMENGMKMLYSPEIRVKHLEDVSTNASIKSGLRKFKMKNREMEKSIKVFLHLMDMEEENR